MFPRQGLQHSTHFQICRMPRDIHIVIAPRATCSMSWTHGNVSGVRIILLNLVHGRESNSDLQEWRPALQHMSIRQKCISWLQAMEALTCNFEPLQHCFPLFTHKDKIDIKIRFHQPLLSTLRSVFGNPCIKQDNGVSGKRWFSLHIVPPWSTFIKNVIICHLFSVNLLISECCPFSCS